MVRPYWLAGSFALRLLTQGFSAHGACPVVRELISLPTKILLPNRSFVRSIRILLYVQNLSRAFFQEQKHGSKGTGTCLFSEKDP